jgi:hypothetical protein
LGVPAAGILESAFNISPWSANLILAILSKGAMADEVGNLAFSLLSVSHYASFLNPDILAGIQRRVGRSLINRGLVFVYSMGATVISKVSRWLHGFSLTGGAMGNTGEAMPSPGGALGMVYSLLSSFIPIERLHIIPNRRGGKIHTDNAAYGAAATNSMMIPHEAAASTAVAIQTPGGMLDSMGMRGGLFMGRGVRPREGIGEHIVNKTLGIA